MKGHALVGRSAELTRLRACLRCGRNVLLEGPVGAGKTRLALAVLTELKRPYFRVDGDGRYSEQKLAGWFDPPAVLKKGYTKAAFMPGPLVEAMQAGGVLFINELNRLPEGVQNVLLPAIDERVIHLPRLGEVRAAKGFLVVATQNPREFVATSHLSEAILDRFELVAIDYQNAPEETEIVSGRLARGAGEMSKEQLAGLCVRLARHTRGHPRVRRGSSIRGAMATAELASALCADGLSWREAFVTAALLALPTRIELERSIDESEAGAGVEDLIREWAGEVLAGSPAEPDRTDAVQKKKS